MPTLPYSRPSVEFALFAAFASNGASIIDPGLVSRSARRSTGLSIKRSYFSAASKCTRKSLFKINQMFQRSGLKLVRSYEKHKA